MKNKKDWLDKHSNASMVLSDIVLEIRSLSKAFSITGNVHVSTSLATIAFDIEKANKIMQDAVGESLQESIKRSGDSSKAIFEAALAGIVLASKDREKLQPK